MRVRKTVIIEKTENGNKTIEVKKESANIKNTEDLFNFLVGD